MNAVAASLLIAAMAATSCVNEDYDLRKPIDLTVTVDGDISLPLVKNTEFITVGQLLGDALEEGGSIVSVPFGNEGKSYYMLSMKSDPDNPIYGDFGQLDFDIAGSFNNFTPLPLTVSTSLGNGLSIDLAQAIGDLPPYVDINDILVAAGLGSTKIAIVGNTPGKINTIIETVSDELNRYGIAFKKENINYPEPIEINVNAKDNDAMPIDIATELPAIVGDIGEIEVGADLTFRLGPNFGKVVLKSGFKMNLPEKLHLKKLSQDKSWSLSGSTIVFTEDFNVYENTELKLRITGIDGTDSVTPKPDGSGSDLIINEKISIEGIALCDVKELLEDPKIKDQVIVDPIAFKVEIVLGDEIAVGNVQVKLDFNAGLGDAAIENQEIELGDILPDAISTEDIQLDIDNPIILLTISNNSPLEASLKAQVQGYDADGRPISGTDIDLAGLLDVDADTGDRPQKVAISRKGLTAEQREEWEISDKNDIKISRLGNLMMELPHKITIEDIGIEPVGGDEFMNINLEDYSGKNLDFSCDYEVRAPLAFGEDLEIRYGLEPIKGLNKNFSSVTESEENGMKINLNDLHLNLSVLNSLPLALGLEVTPIDLEGNPIKSDDLKVEINFSNAENTQEILSGKRNGTDTETQKTDISILIAPKSIEVLEQFDGVEIFLVGNDGQAAGVALNDHHGVQITDVTVRILGGVEINGGNIELIK